MAFWKKLIPPCSAPDDEENIVMQTQQRNMSLQKREKIVEDLVNDTTFDLETFKLPPEFYKALFQGDVLTGYTGFFTLINLLLKNQALTDTHKARIEKFQEHYIIFCALLRNNQQGFEKEKGMTIKNFVHYIEFFISIVKFEFLDDEIFGDLKKTYENKINSLRFNLETDAAFCILKRYKEKLTRKIKDSELLPEFSSLKIMMTAYQIAKNYIERKEGGKEKIKIDNIDVKFSVTIRNNWIAIYHSKQKNIIPEFAFSKKKLRQELQNELGESKESLKLSK
jgi:hypothetical protein